MHKKDNNIYDMVAVDEVRRSKKLLAGLCHSFIKTVISIKESTVGFIFIRNVLKRDNRLYLYPRE